MDDSTSDTSRYVPHMLSLLKTLGDSATKRNLCHGLLCQLAVLLDLNPDLTIDEPSKAELLEAIRGTFWIAAQATAEKPCFVVADEWLKMLNLILLRFPKLLDDDLASISSHLEAALFSQPPIITSGREIFLFKVVYMILIMTTRDTTVNLVIQCLKHTDYEVNLSALNYLLILHGHNDDSCAFLEHLSEISQEDILEVIEKEENYFKLLCSVSENGYLECKQKALRVLALTNDTQKDIVKLKLGKDVDLTETDLVMELIDSVKNGHASLSSIYLDSLLRLVSKSSVSLDVVRVLYASSSAGNEEETREAVVRFLERNLGVLLEATPSEDQAEMFEWIASLWAAVAMLLEDDAPAVRQRAASAVKHTGDTGSWHPPTLASHAARQWRRAATCRVDAPALLLALAAMDFCAVVETGDKLGEETYVNNPEYRWQQVKPLMDAANPRLTVLKREERHLQDHSIIKSTTYSKDNPCLPPKDITLSSAMKNETFVVASVEDCASVLTNDARLDDYLWRETGVGCKVLLLLQEIHKFNITYLKGPRNILEDYERKGSMYQLDDEAVDIYVKPRTLWTPILSNGTPIMPIFNWRFGFTLRRSDRDVQHFYRLPFTATVWQSLLGMVLLVSVLFYVLHRAEQRLLGRNMKCYFSLELLIAIGACCQHYLPIKPMELTSRRIAFFCFFLFSYIVYAYYTSTLLSDLVNDKDNDMDLKTLAGSTYDHVVLDSVAVIIKITPQHLTFIKNKLTNIQVVNVTTGLAAVKTGKTALLSDYISLYVDMKEVFTNKVICQLVEVDLFSNVLKYLFTSKDFKYIEEFKISTLRAKETGVLPRLLSNNMHSVPPLIATQCAVSQFQAHIDHVKSPLIILAFSYVLSLLIMLGERVHYNRFKLWPYVE